MMFCKGDMQSILILNQGVDVFSASSRLCTINTKSGIYLAEVDNEFRHQVAQTLDFTFENFPVRYLGMPLTSKRYTATDSDYLVDKMTCRIRSWYTRKLSYTSLVHLANFILISISNYRSQTVILPKKVLNQINNVCKSYLWYGEEDHRAPRNVKWEKVCRPKK